jgi:hypothetical protein
MKSLRTSADDIFSKRKQMSDRDTYFIGAYIVGLIAFVSSWIYAVATYGWFLGLGLGWIPSIFVAILIGLGWPLIAALIALGIAVALLNL